MRSTVDELLEKIDILELVSRYVKLRRTGRNHVGLCPFHKEKTPSFTVNSEKQIYYCFGCHEGGNAINFYMKYENLTFQEALESLAREYGVQMGRKGYSGRTGVYEALAKLSDYYVSNLRNAPQAMKYLSQRGIGREAVEEFRLGYSPKQYDAVAAFLRREGIQADLLVSTGVIRSRDGTIYDMFRGRIVIPIHDASGRVIGFGGRALEKESLPKYINSPESAVFSKGSVLYGIDKAKRAVAEKNEVLVVEGYFDLIALHMKGLKNVVATLGTAITDGDGSKVGQIARLRSYTENVTLMLDGDEAGVKSALRLIGPFSDRDVNGSMVVLPEGHDPDSFVRKEGIEGIRRLLEEKKPLLDYLFDYHIAKSGVGTLEGRMAFLKAVLPSVEGIKDKVKQRLYVKRLAELTGVEEECFPGARREAPVQEEPRDTGSGSLIGRRVVGAIVNNPGLLGLFRGKEVIGYIKDGTVKDLLLTMTRYYDEKRSLDLNSFMSVLDREDLKRFVLDATIGEADPDDEEPERVVWDYVRHVEAGLCREKLRGITERLQEAEKQGDEKEIARLLHEKKQVLSLIKPNFVK